MDILMVLYIPNPSSRQEMKEINIDVKLYCLVNTSFVSTRNHTHFQSLFDWGANGGVAVDDATIIYTYPHRHFKT